MRATPAVTPDPHPVPLTPVTDSPIVHVQSDPKAELFWRGVMVVGLFFVAVIVAILIGVPAFLMVAFWNPWLLFTLVFAAGGVLLLVKVVQALEGRLACPPPVDLRAARGRHRDDRMEH